MGSASLANGPEGVALYQGLDYSGSFLEHTEAAIDGASGLAAQMEPDTDHVRLYRMDCDSAELYDQAPPEDAATLAQVLREQLKEYPAAPGTFSQRFWTDLARDLDAESRRTSVILWSDGDLDSRSSAAIGELRAAGRRLAANPNVVYVGIFGVRPSNRKMLRQAFAELDRRNILFIYGLDDIDLGPFGAALSAARR